jgi:hypothetical protein
MTSTFFKISKGLRMHALPIFGMILAFAAPSKAVILSPISATASSEFDSAFSINNTINQSGLSSTFNSGVDDFDAYIGTNPTHTAIAPGFEWFTSGGVTSAIVNYDLGAIYSVDKFALWNEESSGIGKFDLFASKDGSSFTSLLTGVSPFDNPLDASFGYPAEVFEFGKSVNARFFKFSIYDSPQPDPGSFNGAAIGEIAFNVNPVPGPLPILGVAAVFGYSRKIRKRLKDSKTLDIMSAIT